MTKRERSSAGEARRPRKRPMRSGPGPAVAPKSDRPATHGLDLSDGNPSNQFFDEPMPFQPALHGTELRDYVRGRRFSRQMYQVPHPEDLRRVVDVYDMVAFDGHLWNHIRSARFDIEFEFGTVETDDVLALAECTVLVAEGAMPAHEFGFPYRSLLIRIDAPLIESAFSGSADTVRIDGVTCKDPLDAVLVVLEHELLHAYEAMRFRVHSHGAMFRYLGGVLFGHVLGDDRFPSPIPGTPTSASGTPQAGGTPARSRRSRR